jgi:FKBP-type peptidyl-prolyl cis-trans isomerase FkpA
MKTRLALVILAVNFIFLFSCKDENAFKKHESGFEYRIVTENKSGIPVKNDDYVEVDLKYYTGKDSLLFDTKDIPNKFRLKVVDKEIGGLIQEAFKLMKTGDSAIFKIPAENFYKKTAQMEVPNFIKKDDILKFEIKLNQILSEKEMQAEYEQYLSQKQAEEVQILKEYLSVENIGQAPTESGLYIISLEKGNGKKAKKGSKVSVHYTGKFINGQIFDSSVDSGTPFEFELGSGKVIQAWDEAIATMRVGDKIKIIAPSNIAYGAQGYSPVIPPYETLVFEIKLLDVK